MKQGAWHQFGHQSQKFAIEQMEQGAGVGVVISTADLARHLAQSYSERYREAGAEVWIDPQFYVPDSEKGYLETYDDIYRFRDSVFTLNQIGGPDLDKFARGLEKLNRDIASTAVVAPAVVYDAGRSDIEDLNERLFRMAKSVGDRLGVPTVASVFVGNSAAGKFELVDRSIAGPTSWDCDGFYFGFEFSTSKVPTEAPEIATYLQATLALASSGKPVLNAFSALTSLLAIAAGATGVGVGHWQNLWNFERTRWREAPTRSGGPKELPPPRYFSKSIWGTVIYPEEMALLGEHVAAKVICESPFSSVVSSAPPYLAWSRTEANKHLVYTIMDMVESVLSLGSVGGRLEAVKNHLASSCDMIDKAKKEGVSFKDGMDVYQPIWLNCVEGFQADQGASIEFLDFM